MDDSEKNKEKLVMPGDVVATAEEYVPGRNTTEDSGTVISLAFGELRKDDDDLTISVNPPKRKIRIYPDQIVYGRIVKMDQRRANIKVGAVFDKNLGLVEYNADGSVGLSSHNGRSNDPGMHVGDIIRAKVLRKGPRGLDLGIFGKNLGVLKTLCTKCRLPLVKKGTSLYCENCERTELRRVAEDYGNVNIMEDTA